MEIDSPPRDKGEGRSASEPEKMHVEEESGPSRRMEIDEDYDKEEEKGDQK
jgi:hypothetical protein